MKKTTLKTKTNLDPSGPSSPSVLGGVPSKNLRRNDSIPEDTF